MTIYYGRLSTKAASAVMLKEENDNLRHYLARVVEIEKSYKENREIAARIAQMAGVDLENIESPAKIDWESIDTLVEEIQEEIVPVDSPYVKMPLSPEELANERIPSGRPLYGWITRAFIPDEAEGKESHHGIDFAVKQGTSVKATASGAVNFAGWDKDFGYLVVLNHGNGFQTRYGHNDKLLVEMGEEVLKGDVIALSGNTGRSSAPHLHYEIRKDGQPVDPADYIE
jgi:murein DD-endopeptidase MepM/ murein hydrolase activator NlpD